MYVLDVYIKHAVGEMLRFGCYFHVWYMLEINGIGRSHFVYQEMPCLISNFSQCLKHESEAPFPDISCGVEINFSTIHFSSHLHDNIFENISDIYAYLIIIAAISDHIGIIFSLYIIIEMISFTYQLLFLGKIELFIIIITTKYFN